MNFRRYRMSTGVAVNDRIRITDTHCCHWFVRRPLLYMMAATGAIDTKFMSCTLVVVPILSYTSFLVSAVSAPTRKRNRQIAMFDSRDTAPLFAWMTSVWNVGHTSLLQKQEMMR